MTSRSLNSGAINAVSFPSSEQGTSVIELEATVEVTASISLLNARLSIKPTTIAKASPGSPVTKLRMQVAAAGQPSAVSADVVASYKTKYTGSASCAALTSSANVVIRRNIAGSAQATATTSAKAVSRCQRGAATPAAATGYVGGFNATRLAASAAAKAVPKAGIARSRIYFGCAQKAAAIQASSITISSRLTAEAEATAPGSAVSGVLINRSAATQAGAGSSQAAIGLRVATGVSVEAGANGSSGLKMRMAPSGSTVGLALTSEPEVHLALMCSASAVATAIPSVVAYDFATEIPAPVDRQIVVPPYDRTMKVVA